MRMSSSYRTALRLEAKEKRYDQIKGNKCYV